MEESKQKRRFPHWVTDLLINVTHCLFSIHNQVALPYGSFSWGYCEFEIIENKRFRLSIISDVTNQFVFEFENIALHKLSAI